MEWVEYLVRLRLTGGAFIGPDRGGMDMRRALAFHEWLGEAERR